MKITIVPTEEFFMAGNVMVRAWEGTNDKGEHVVALISGVAIGSGPTEEGEVRPPVIPGLISIPPPNEEEQKHWAEEIMRRVAP